jgi:glycosyltransferase involved in cell wall biosynthesis
LGNRRLKILFITPWYPIAGRPDGIFVQELARAVQRKNEVAVLHHVGKDSTLRHIWRMAHDEAESAAFGFPVYRFWYRESPVPNSSFFLFGLWSLWGALRQLIQAGYRPDILHVHEYPFAALALVLRHLYGIPVVISEHSSSFPKQSLTLWQYRLARFAFRHADRVLPVSQPLQRAIENYGLTGRFEVVPNVVDTGLFQINLQKAPPPPKRLLFVGLLDPLHKKGIPYLLHALAQLPRRDWQLDLVGDGPTRAEYEALAATLGIAGQITFHGYQPKPVVAQLMQNSHLFVLPSVVETFGVVLIEALASGLPVVATRTEGPGALISDEVGILVPPGDADALAAAINTMLDSYTRYSPQALAAYVERHFSYTTVGDKVDAIYRSLLVDRT